MLLAATLSLDLTVLGFAFPPTVLKVHVSIALRSAVGPVAMGDTFVHLDFKTCNRMREMENKGYDMNQLTGSTKNWNFLTKKGEV
jgi:hypothetical protein